MAKTKVKTKPTTQGKGPKATGAVETALVRLNLRACAAEPGPLSVSLSL